MSEEIKEAMSRLKRERESKMRAEVEGLISALYGGITVMPSDMVQETTILVRPEVYEALHKRIASDTAKARDQDKRD